MANCCQRVPPPTSRLKALFRRNWNGFPLLINGHIGQAGFSHLDELTLFSKAFCIHLHLNRDGAWVTI